MKKTIEQVRAAMYQLMTIPGQAKKARKILKKHDSLTISDLDKKYYGSVIKKANKAYKKKMEKK